MFHENHTVVFHQGSTPGICTNSYRSTCNKTESVIDDVFQRCEWKSSCLVSTILGGIKLPTIQEWLYCQLCFRCTIRKELDQWSLQLWNIIILHPLTSELIFANIWKLEINGKTKLAIMMILPILDGCEKSDCHNLFLEIFDFYLFNRYIWQKS